MTIKRNPGDEFEAPGRGIFAKVIDHIHGVGKTSIEIHDPFITYESVVVTLQELKDIIAWAEGKD